MYCPNCKAEYRPGFTHCYDCDVDLVEELSVDERLVDDEIEWRSVWKGNSQADCVDFCKELREANVPYLVKQTPEGFVRRMEVDFKYEIGVSKADYSRAMEIVGTEEGGSEDSIEISAADAPQIQRSSDRVSDGNSYDEGAEVEVFTQARQDHSSIVELSLSTNRIHFRTEVEEDGTRRFFVAPEDEAPAREITRQIREGTPPN